MQFEDRYLLLFSDPAAALGVFSDESAKSVVSASYGVAEANLIGAATPRFDKFEFAPFSGAVSTEITSDHHVTQRAEVSGPIAPGLNPRMDLLWTGAITVSSAFPRAEIGVERAAAPILADIDADIPAPVPADAAGLEAARRVVVLDRLRAAAQNPVTVTDELLDSWLADAGLDSVTEFLDRAAASAVPIRQFVLSFTPLPGTAAPAPVTFPIAAAALIRDTTAPDFRLVDLLQASRTAQARLEIEGVAPKPTNDGIPRGKPAILWVVAEEWFDDSDWPGGIAGNAAARRAARITMATGWLAAQGIALVTVPG